MSEITTATTTTDTGEISELEANLVTLRRQVDDGLPHQNWVNNDEDTDCDEENEETRLRRRQAH